VRRSHVAAVVSLLIAVTPGCSPSERRPESAAFRPLDVGSQVPAYTVQSLGGDSLSVGGPGAPTVLHVWATWCESCREEMEALDSLRSEFGGRGARVIGVSVDLGATEKVRRFARTNHLGFTVAHDPAGEIQKSYQVVGVPTTFVISGDGRLLWKHTGNIADNFAEARAAVSKAVSAEN
jgi:peroxiredoxin